MEDIYVMQVHYVNEHSQAGRQADRQADRQIGRYAVRSVASDDIGSAS